MVKIILKAVADTNQEDTIKKAATATNRSVSNFITHAAFTYAKKILKKEDENES